MKKKLQMKLRKEYSPEKRYDKANYFFLDFFHNLKEEKNFREKNKASTNKCLLIFKTICSIFSSSVYLKSFCKEFFF